MTERHAGNPPQGRLRCAYCHDGFGDEGQQSACAGCGTLLHPACLQEVAACPVLGCGVQLGTAERGGRSPTELYTQALNQSMGSSLRWSVGLCVAGCLLLSLPGALASGDIVLGLATMLVSGMVGALIGMLVGGLVGSVREKRLFEGDWVRDLRDPPE